jgi:hypothetical protein
MQGLQDVQNAVMVIPTALSNAVMDWPAWIGFGALEGFGYYAQSVAIDIWPNLPGASFSTNQMLRGVWAATVRGGLFASNLNYWNAYNSMGGGNPSMPINANFVSNLFNGLPIQRPQIG